MKTQETFLRFFLDNQCVLLYIIGIVRKKEIITMNRQQRKAQEKALIKNAAKNFAVNFKLSIAEDNAYTMLSVFNMKTIKQIADTCDYDNDKCYDIVLEASQNVIAKLNNHKEGNTLTAEQENVVLQSMRNVSLAVLKMIQNDPYKSVGIQPNVVMNMDLMEDEDGNVGFNLLGDGQSMLSMKKGVASAIKSAKKDVDFMVTLA